MRATLVALPVIAAALVGIDRWSREHGGRGVPARVAVTEVVLLGLLVLLAAGRDHLGLAANGSRLEGLVAGGLAVVLMHRIGWLLVGLRPVLGSTLPRRPPWPFFALPLVAYLAILPWSSFRHQPDGDEPHYLLVTHSLAYDLDTDLRNNYEQGDSRRFLGRRLDPQPGDPVGKSGQQYSRHNILLPALLAPFYRLFGKPGALAVMAALAAAVCWLMLALCHEYEPRRPGEALAAYAMLAFTAPLLLFSYQVWVEVPAALLTLLVVVRIYRLRGRGAAGRGDVLALAIPWLLLPVLKLRFSLIAGPLLLLAWWRGGRSVRRKVAPLVGAAGLLALAILVFNLRVFGNPLKYHAGTLRSQLWPSSGALEGLAGLSFDCAFGLFSSAPIWMLLLPAMLLGIGRRDRRFLDFLVIFCPYLLAVSVRPEWFGGWAPPFRYGVVALPFLALWLIPLLASRRGALPRALIAGLAALSLGLALLWLVQPGWTYNLAHGRSHLLDLLAERLGADVARFFPSSTRPRAATWLWPPLALAILSALWWRVKAESRHAVAAGVSAVLLGLAILPWAARDRATRVVEFEDPWVAKSAGQVYPELWVIQRHRFRDGWILPEGGTLTAPVVPGGRRLSLEVRLRAHSEPAAAGRLLLGDGSGRLLAERPLSDSPDWQAVVFDDLWWPAAGRLRLSVRRLGEGGRPVVILDRADLTWQEGLW